MASILRLGLAPARLVLADPGRLLDQRAALLGLRRHDLGDLALLHDRVALGADAGVAEEVLHVAQAARGAVEQVLGLPGPEQPARDLDLRVGRERGRRGAVAVVERERDLGHSHGGEPSEPAKITSSMPLPRSRRGACSPITQRIASTTFDLPQPLGPTTPVMPGLNETTVLSTNDLKPWSSSDLSRT